MGRISLAALVLLLNFASASAQGTCESRAVSREGKPLAGAAKASFLKVQAGHLPSAGGRERWQATCWRCKEKLHAKVPARGVAALAAAQTHRPA
jgi:hypothetical protein